MKPPYLSLVIPTSNDTYPSNELRVQNKCLSILQHQLERARLESEILVVEYNPDPSRPHLHESLRVDAGHYVTIKAIIVDPKYHRRYRGWEKRRFHQTLAVNVGLRRSRGRFLVYRAADQIYSEALVWFLSARALAADGIYRCDRVDVTFPDWDEVQPDDAARISRTCEEHVVRRYELIDLSSLDRSAHCNQPLCSRTWSPAPRLVMRNRIFVRPAATGCPAHLVLRVR